MSELPDHHHCSKIENKLLISRQYKAPPWTSWAEPRYRGSERNFNVALISIDFPDMPFAITLPPNSTIFGNPQPGAPLIKRRDVPAFYRDFLNKPSDLNHGHTLHEYWMENSGGRFGVDLTSFGPYTMKLKSYQYGIQSSHNPGACPSGKRCDRSIHKHALKAWVESVGLDVSNSFEQIFIQVAGQDESSTWQEFGEMKFQTKDDIPDSFGPPGSMRWRWSSRNHAVSRYVSWTSWAAAAAFWPTSQPGSAVLAEGSGMAVYAHELSHLLGIDDNYHKPFSNPPRRNYAGLWSMMAAGTLNGPGGPHTRWHIPATQGASLGSHHTVRDKAQLGLIDERNIISLSREALADSGLVVARITARSVAPAPWEYSAIRISMSEDRSPACDVNTDPYCDGGNFDEYFVEGKYSSP